MVKAYHDLYELGYLKKGKVVEVDVSEEIEVKLMTRPEYEKFNLGLRHTYYGGLVKRVPYYIEVPFEGEFVLVIDTSINSLLGSEVESYVEVIDKEDL